MKKVTTIHTITTDLLELIRKLEDKSISQKAFYSTFKTMYTDLKDYPELIDITCDIDDLCLSSIYPSSEQIQRWKDRLLNKPSNGFNKWLKHSK